MHTRQKHVRRGSTRDVIEALERIKELVLRVWRTSTAVHSQGVLDWVGWERIMLWLGGFVVVVDGGGWWKLALVFCCWTQRSQHERKLGTGLNCRVPPITN